MGVLRAKPTAVSCGESDSSLALRQTDRDLDALCQEADQLDAMALYLQRRRDAVEDRWAELLAARDRLESDLWECAALAVAEVADVPVSEAVSIEAVSREIDRRQSSSSSCGAANVRPLPPDVSARRAPSPASAGLLLHAWGLLVGAGPRPPDLSGWVAPRPLAGPLLETWALE